MAAVRTQDERVTKFWREQMEMYGRARQWDCPGCEDGVYHVYRDGPLVRCADCGCMCSDRAGVESVTMFLEHHADEIEI